MDVLTGNEIMSGATVYLDAGGHWVEDINAARLFDTPDAEARDAAIVASKKTQRINDVAAESVTIIDGRPVPDRMRERIRVSGPTAPRHDRQHLDEDGHVSI